MLELNLYNEVRFVLYKDLSSCGTLISVGCIFLFFLLNIYIHISIKNLQENKLLFSIFPP